MSNKLALTLLTITTLCNTYDTQAMDHHSIGLRASVVEKAVDMSEASLDSLLEASLNDENFLRQNMRTVYHGKRTMAQVNADIANPV